MGLSEEGSRMANGCLFLASFSYSPCGMGDGKRGLGREVVNSFFFFFFFLHV